jgi:Icc-related predicted phosphoesterase
MTVNTKAVIKTRLLIISDTHDGFQGQQAKPYASNTGSFRPPFPKADVLLHSGDLTMIGTMAQYRNTLAMLKDMDAELKLVIAGNHDLSLHTDYYIDKDGKGHAKNLQGLDYDKDTARQAIELWTGQAAKDAGVTYLTEGLHTFELSNGAMFTIYASAWQPWFFDWAFNYKILEDRWNPPHLVTGEHVTPSKDDPHPIPEDAKVDIVMTHGPPKGHLDKCVSGVEAGCPHLLKALKRVRPRLHCFGHIHEGWGCERVHWEEGGDEAGELGEATEIVGHLSAQGTNVQRPDDVAVLERRAAYIDVSSESTKPLQLGEETLLVNSCIMDVSYKAEGAGWVVDIDLPLKIRPGLNGED